MRRSIIKDHEETINAPVLARMEDEPICKAVR